MSNNKLDVSDINVRNSSIYKLASKASVINAMPTALQTATGNNVTAGELIKPNKLDIIKNAINILENNFSNNCCQANCLTHKTSSKCQVQCYSSYTNCTTVWSYTHTTRYC